MPPEAAEREIRARGRARTMESPMPYLCFIESDILSVPHMEALIADDPARAEAEAADLLAQHSSGYAAHVFDGDQRIATIRKPAADRVAPHLRRCRDEHELSLKSRPELARLARGLRSPEERDPTDDQDLQPLPPA